MNTKERLSASVDAELLAIGHRAVAEGRADSLSAWINDALRLKADHDARLEAIDDFLAAYEDEHGAITDQEMHDAARNARARAVVVRSEPEGRQVPTPRPSGTA
jgi:hypothetical protein